MKKLLLVNPDAFIISDFGILNTVKKYTKNIDIHISTQTNTLNSEACKFYRDLGASRVILARELSLKQIETIRKNVPMLNLKCLSTVLSACLFSGRCLLSDFMTKGERRANHGECAQPCRWSYKLLEETRPNEYYEIVQDNRGSHILSTKDLALIDYIQNIIDMNIDSLKIEGRTKSLYYVSAIARAYRCQIDRCLNKNKIELNQNLKEELAKIGNRGYTTGFVVPEDESANGYSYDISKGLAGADFLLKYLKLKTTKF
ncbi:MAG: U32 family peptidase [Candidatus Melainabacteria bacterium]|nr:MAG: U32 family peptidase [Candidatus Melainabacteria bacterium]